MSFDIDVGLASLQGRQPRNEDFAGVQRAPGRGWVAALADGVGTGAEQGDGLMAAQTSVMTLLSDFPDATHWEANVAMDRILAAQNTWLAAHNRRSGPARQALTTLTAIVLHGHRYALAHVGDSRAWLLRDGLCLQLTQDHRLPRADLTGLTRALGLDDTLRLEHSQGELRVADRLLLTSHGVHEFLSPREIARQLRDAASAQEAAEVLTAAAQAAGSAADATALVVEVRSLEAEAPPPVAVTPGHPSVVRRNLLRRWQAGVWLSVLVNVLLAAWIWWLPTR